MNLPLPLPVARAIKKLGADLSLARRRRNMTQAMLAERIGTSVMTVRRIEDGHPGTALQYLAVISIYDKSILPPFMPGLRAGY